MADAEYLREIATRCDAISNDCFDLRAAGRLRLLAEELRTKAAEWPTMFPLSALDGTPEPERDVE
jgi:hypothetical protein